MGAFASCWFRPPQGRRTARLSRHSQVGVLAEPAEQSGSYRPMLKGQTEGRAQGRRRPVRVLPCPQKTATPGEQV